MLIMMCYSGHTSLSLVDLLVKMYDDQGHRGLLHELTVFCYNNSYLHVTLSHPRSRLADKVQCPLQLISQSPLTMFSQTVGN